MIILQVDRVAIAETEAVPPGARQRGGAGGHQAEGRKYEIRRTQNRKVKTRGKQATPICFRVLITIIKHYIIF